jgi:hypothetical protein
MDEREYIYSIIEVWKSSENYTRQLLFSQTPVLYFDKDIQEQYGLVSYAKSTQEYYNFDVDAVDTYDSFFVTLSFFRKENNLRTSLDNGDVLLRVVDDGKKLDSVYIRDDLRYLQSYLYNRIKYDVVLENMSVHVLETQSDMHMRNCNITCLSLFDEDISNLEAIYNDNSITIDIYFCKTIESLYKISVYTDLSINHIQYRLPSGFLSRSISYNFKSDYTLFRGLDGFHDKSELFIYFRTSVDELNNRVYLYQFTKSALDRKGLNSFNFKIYIYFVDMDGNSDTYTDVTYIGILDLAAPTSCNWKLFTRGSKEFSKYINQVLFW